MADNSQNTIAGTSTGGNLITTSGNWFLEQLASVSNIAAAGIGTIGSLSTQALAVKLQLQQLVNPPQQSMPQTEISSPLDVYSDPERVRQLILYAMVATALIGGTVYLAKKV